MKKHSASKYNPTPDLKDQVVWGKMKIKTYHGTHKGKLGITLCGKPALKGWLFLRKLALWMNEKVNCPNCLRIKPSLFKNPYDSI